MSYATEITAFSNHMVVFTALLYKIYYSKVTDSYKFFDKENSLKPTSRKPVTYIGQTPTAVARDSDL